MKNSIYIFIKLLINSQKNILILIFLFYNLDKLI